MLHPIPCCTNVSPPPAASGSRRSRLRLYAAACTVIGLLLGCGGSTDPTDELRGSYELLSVNGEPLPYVYYRNVVEGRVVEYRVHAARIEFRTRRRVYDIRTVDFLDPRPDTIVSGYALEGSQLLFNRSATAARTAYTDTGSYEPAILTMHMRHLPGMPDANDVFLYGRSAP